MKGDDRVDEALAAKGAGNMERFLALHEFEPEARQRLPHAVYEYVAGGAGEEHSIRANEESYCRSTIDLTFCFSRIHKYESLGC